MNFLVNFLAYSILVPIAAGMVCLAIPDRFKNVTKFIAFSTTLASVASAVLIFIRKPLYWPPVPLPVFVVDDLSGFVGLFISIFAFLVTIYSFGFIAKNTGRYFGYVLMTLGASLGTVFTNDLIVLCIFWGFSGALLYLLVNMQGTDSSSASAKKAFIIIGGTDALMILGIGFIWKIAGTTSMERIRLSLDGAFPCIAYLSIAIASFAKAGAVPFHSWLPDVAGDGPTPVTAYLPASLDKLLGIYLLAKASLHLFVMNNISNVILLIVGSITIVFAVMMALVQHDLKRLLGYHAVSQVGYMVLGIGTGTSIGIAGGLFHMVNHAIYKSCLFLSAGAVEKRTGTTDLSRLGGLAKYMPLTFLCFLIASLSISGVPPFNGFASKWMIYQGIIELGKGKHYLWIIWLVSAMFGSALTMASFIKLLHAVFLGRPSGDFTSWNSASLNFKNIKEVGLSMSVPIMVLAAACFIFGVFALALPISIFILPAIGGKILYFGIWSSGTATVLLIIGIILGILVYKIILPGKSRSVSVFIGGEDVKGLARVSGVEFYDTIKEVKGLDLVYKKEEAKSLDVYEQGKKVVSFFTRILQYLHNGVLPTYLVWCLLGMMVMFLVLCR